MHPFWSFLIIDSVLAVLVYIDARRFDWTSDGMSKAWHWPVGMYIFWPAVVALYLMRRRKRPLLSATH
jgi:hypothetical protein